MQKRKNALAGQKKPRTRRGSVSRLGPNQSGGHECCYDSGANITAGFEKSGVDISHLTNLLRRLDHYGWLLQLQTQILQCHKDQISNSAGYEQTP